MIRKFFTFDSRLTATLQKIYLWTQSEDLVTIGFVGGQKSSSLKSIVPIMRGTHSVVSHSVSMTSNARV